MTSGGLLVEWCLSPVSFIPPHGFAVHSDGTIYVSEFHRRTHCRTNAAHYRNLKNAIGVAPRRHAQLSIVLSDALGIARGTLISGGQGW